MSYDDSMEDKVEGYKREIASIESMLKFVIIISCVRLFFKNHVLS